MDGDHIDPSPSVFSRYVVSVRRALAELGFVRTELERQPRPAKARAHTRVLEPPAERALPAEAGAARARPSLGLFRRHWMNLLSYLFIIVAFVIIGGVGYTTYAFSRYQGLILPGVYVGSLHLGDMTLSQGEGLLVQRIASLNNVPFEFRYGRRTWKPSQKDIGLTYDFNTTISNAFSIGRSNSFWRNLIDRLPIRRHFSIGLVSHFNRAEARIWVIKNLVSVIHRPMVNASLAVDGAHVVSHRSQTGYHVDLPAAMRDIAGSVGGVSLRKIPVPLDHLRPRITNITAAAIATNINQFLKHPPILRLRHQEIKTNPLALAGMISFTPHPKGPSPTIIMNVDTSALDRYVNDIASTYDVSAQSPDLAFNAGAVTLISPRRVGRVMDENLGASRLLKAFRSLTPHHVIRVPVHKVPPPVSSTNPGSLGVNTFLGEGSSRFVGSQPIRGKDIRTIAAQLNGVVIKPNQDMSFDHYVGTSWPSRVYQDVERRVNGQYEPGTGGAMQQVATTFLRAGYHTGLPILERYSHHYRLPWYQPPAGLDAVVSPYAKDLRFRNTTGGYLLLQTRVDPIEKVLYVYIYGRNSGWNIQVGTPIISRVHHPAGSVVERDPSLRKGIRLYQSYPETGADVTIARTVTIPSRKHGGKAKILTDTLSTHYQAQQGVILVGTRRKPVATPTPTPSPTPTPTPSPTPTPTPGTPGPVKTPGTSPTQTPAVSGNTPPLR